MAYRNEDVQLLESLIKMVGKSNQKVDQLQKRVSQLEWLLREKSPTHLEPQKVLQQ